MRKSQIIASCLVNSGFFATLDQAEDSVESIFKDEFHTQNYHTWNSDVNSNSSENIIKTVGKASSINVRSFIKDLWNAQ